MSGFNRPVLRGNIEGADLVHRIRRLRVIRLVFEVRFRGDFDRCSSAWLVNGPDPSFDHLRSRRRSRPTSDTRAASTNPAFRRSICCRPESEESPMSTA